MHLGAGVTRCTTTKNQASDRERSPRNCGVVGQHKDAHLFTGRENFADRLMKGGVGSITESGESSAERRGTSSNVENFVPATQSVKSARSGRQPSPPGCLVRTVLRPRPAIFQKDAFSKPVPINVLRLAAMVVSFDGK